MATTARVPTSPSNIKMINAMQRLMSKQVTALADRWASESKYEDIGEYRKVIEKVLPKTFKVTKMTKKPFGFHFTIGTDAEYSLFCSARSYGWKRLS